MERRTKAEIWGFVILVSLGVALRILCNGMPNIAPTAAFAMFAGYYFRNWRVAVAVPLLVMLISDQFIGAYSWIQMLTVYTALSLPVLLRCFLRTKLSLLKPSLQQSVSGLAGITGCSIICSLVFFLATNFSVWLDGVNYSLSLSGLISCYVAALPFLRYTLQGDLLFSFATFGSYALIGNLGLLYQSRSVTNNQVETIR